MAINRRQKGNKGESEVAELLSKWTGKKIARAETNNMVHERNAYNSKGDVICKDEGHFFPLCTEVKFYADINFEHLLYLPKPLILNFWEQVIGDAKRCKKCPVLFMRYNGLPRGFFFVAIPLKIYYQFFEKYIKPPHKGLIVIEHGFIIITTNEFFQAPYKEIRKPIKLYYKQNPQ